MRRYCYAPRTLDPVLGLVADTTQPSRWNRERSGTSRWSTGGILALSTPQTGKRILVLGDSMTDAMQVDEDQGYPALTSRTLAASGHALTVLDAGIAGVSLGRYIALADDYQARFAPAWTVVQFDGMDFPDTWVLSDSHFAGRSWSDHAGQDVTKSYLARGRRRAESGSTYKERSVADAMRA